MCLVRRKKGNLIVLIKPISVSSGGQIESLMLLQMLQCPRAGAGEEREPHDFTFSLLAAWMDRCIDYCAEGEILSVATHTLINTSIIQHNK